MGLTYKVLKHRSIEMDLRKTRRSRDMVERLSMEQQEELEDKPTFTAEHILQLCRFLAEKSQAKKTQQRFAHAQQQLCPTVSCPNTAMEYDNFDIERHTEGATHLPSNAVSNCPIITVHDNSKVPANITTSHVLLDRLSNINNNSNTNDSMATLSNTACLQRQRQQQQQQQTHIPSQHQLHTQDKREILRKIRQQIFERKRLRQLVHVQQHLTADVWRPW